MSREHKEAHTAEEISGHSLFDSSSAQFDHILVRFFQAAPHFFLLTNTHYLLSTALEQLGDEVDLGVVDGFRHHRDLATEGFLQAFLEPIREQLAPVEYGGNANRPSKEGAKLLKSRFGILNACFSELETIGRDWRVLDDELRYSLLNRLVEEVQREEHLPT